MCPPEVNHLLEVISIGAVSASRYDIEATSFSPFTKMSLMAGSQFGSLSYVLSPSDGPVLSEFLTHITPFVPNTEGLSSEKPDFLTTALRWYEDALGCRFRPEGQVASAVACLEALFLHRVQSEVNYRLAQRTAGLLRWFGFSPLEVRDTLSKKAYDVRGRYVHGEMQERTWTRDDLSDLSRAVLDYARASLLVFCQLRHLLPRSDLLQLVDESLLDDPRRESLQICCARIQAPPRPTTESSATYGGPAARAYPTFAVPKLLRVHLRHC